MSTERESELSAALAAAGRAEHGAADRLFEIVYDELRRMAAQRMRAEAGFHTLQPTALVNEAFMRLMGHGGPVAWQNRAHFFGAAAEAMRRILVEHARSRGRAKRGGGRRRLELRGSEAPFDADPADVLALDEALSRLAAFDPRLAHVVTLRCFLGLTITEAAEALGVSSRTVDRDWTVARAWLKAELGPGADPDAHGGPNSDKPQGMDDAGRRPGVRDDA